MINAQNLWRDKAIKLHQDTFGAANNAISVDTIPGRVNLIGEHLGYHLLPVLPMAIDRHVVIAFRVNELRQIRAISSYGDREVPVALGQQVPGPAGDWANYIRAAIDTVCRKWTIIRGLDAALVSNLP
jgi:galactokinase